MRQWHVVFCDFEMEVETDSDPALKLNEKFSKIWVCIEFVNAK